MFYSCPLCLFWQFHSSSNHSLQSKRLPMTAVNTPSGSELLGEHREEAEMLNTDSRAASQTAKPQGRRPTNESARPSLASPREPDEPCVACLPRTFSIHRHPVKLCLSPGGENSPTMQRRAGILGRHAATAGNGPFLEQRET